MEPSVTFAVIGRNEEARLERMARDALTAARPGDRVLFVDGDSSDGSAAAAAALGLEVVPAGAGKGRAVARALVASRTGRTIMLDADLEDSERNLAAALRDAAGSAELVVGVYDEPARGLWVNRRTYQVLVAALLPEAAHVGGRRPLSGYRCVSAAAREWELPPGYGVETHLNIRYALEGRTTSTVELGRYAGPLRGHANDEPIGRALVAAILDAAERHERLDPELRERWEAWAEPLIELTRLAARDPSSTPQLTARAAALATRPLPPARARAQAS